MIWMNVVALDKIVTLQRISNDSSKEEPEASRVKDIVTKERDSEEYKENGRSTSRDEYHLGHEK